MPINLMGLGVTLLTSDISAPSPPPDNPPDPSEPRTPDNPPQVNNGGGSNGGTGSSNGNPIAEQNIWTSSLYPFFHCLAPITSVIENMNRTAENINNGKINKLGNQVEPKDKERNAVCLSSWM